jgi:hypothetical protein
VTAYPTVPPGLDAIALVDSATEGAAGWTRVNDSTMNPPNCFYTLANPPLWIPQVEDKQDDIRWLLYLRQLPPPLSPTAIVFAPEYRSTVSTISARPNPAMNQALVRYQVPRNTDISLDVFDANGRLVRRLASGPVKSGEHRLTWDGAGRDGRLVAPGVYFVRLGNGGSAATCKLLRE